VPDAPAALMRSRYCAYALNLAPYLMKTLARGHEDRAMPEAELLKALQYGAQTRKFMGLTILRSDAKDDRGHVLFIARVFEKGRDCSFAELSHFVLEEGAWRYLSGILLPKSDIPANLAERSDEEIAALAKAHRHT
jgi:SEC-C motif domain protein